MYTCPKSANLSFASLSVIPHSRTSLPELRALWRRLTPSLVGACTSRICISRNCDLRILTFGVFVLFFVSAAAYASAQAPGTPPPTEILSGSSDTNEPSTENELRIKGFLFLDESGVPVLMPGTSFEEMERLQNLEAGVDSRSQMFDFQSLEISGSATKSASNSQGRAELKIVIRLTIDSTSGRTIAIPLRMKNFHPLGPPDVNGLDDYRMTVSNGDAGHVLLVKTSARREVVVTMNVAARVESGATQEISFQLPDVPSLVKITTDGEGLSGEVVGRGDEVLQVQRKAGRPDQFVIESGGGAFSLRWGKRDRGSDSTPLLEIDNSRMVVQWDSPQDQPIASCQMIVRSVRGSVGSLKIRLPENAVLLDTPTLGNNGQSVEILTPDASESGTILEVKIPEQERQQRIDLNLDLQFSMNDANAQTPLVLKVPEVIGALRQRGEIQVLTGDDYRLRWRSRPWVQSVLAQPSDEAGRSYLFRYDRATFDLPVWLATTRRQLRLSTNAVISIHDTIARIEYTITASGRAAEGTMLKVVFGDWRLRSIENTQTNLQIESVVNDNIHEIYLESVSSGDPAPIRIVAEHDLNAKSPVSIGSTATDANDRSVSFELPYIIDIEDTMLVQSSTFAIGGKGRKVLVVDLESSKNIDRLIGAENVVPVAPVKTAYQVLPPDSRAVLIGKIAEQLPSISLAGDATVEIEGQTIHAVLDWIVNSPLDLEGRLPIQIPVRKSIDPTPSSVNASPAENAAATSIPDPLALTQDVAASGTLSDEAIFGWTVTVNGRPAVLESRGEDRYELVSDQLASGSISIRWNYIRPINAPTNQDQFESLPIPRPFAVDTTFRGSMRVSLVGDRATELLTVPTRYSGEATASTLLGSEAAPPETDVLEGPVRRSMNDTSIALDTLPREPIELRFRLRQLVDDNLFVSRAVLRTVAGYETRMEQVLAEVQGSSELRLGIPVGDYKLSSEAIVDGMPADVRRSDHTLIVSLPSDDASHLVDLRVWLPMESAALASEIEPALTMPMGVGRVYWEIFSPQDSHVIWASPTLGRAMAWRFDSLRLFREAELSSRSLGQWVGGGELVDAPRGNRYLYSGSDVRSFSALVVSRTVLWAVTGSMVLFVAVLLTFVPQTRHPFSAIVAAILFTGLLIIAPDAAVLAGQFGAIALVLVIVMTAIRAMVQSRDSHTALLPRTSRSKRDEKSTRMQAEPPSASRGTMSVTRSIAPTSSSINKVSS